MFGVIFLGIVVHYLLFPYTQHTQKLQQLTTFTSMAKPSLSVSYDASLHNMTYPEMPRLNRMDFVYEQ
jgi:hypothetical protein